MSFLATQLSNKEEKAKLTEIFKSFDKNHDGILSKDELILGYAQLHGSIERAQIEVELVLSRVDTNGNGTIDYSEFLAANLKLTELLTNEKLQAAFNLFDIDQNGRITLEEIKSLLGGENLIMSALGGYAGDQSSQNGGATNAQNTVQQYSNEMWRELIGEGDANDDGEITFEEFKTMMKKMLHK